MTAIPVGQRALVAVAAVLLAACSGSGSGDGEDTEDEKPTATRDEGPDPNDPIAFPNGSPQRDAVATLAAVEALDLTGSDACEAYDASLGSFFATLDHETRRLADGAPKGIPPTALGRFAGWLATREQVLGALVPDDEELARRHEELTAAVGDLSSAFNLFVPGNNDAGVPPGPRIANAATNFAATLEAIEAHCASEPASPTPE